MPPSERLDSSGRTVKWHARRQDVIDTSAAVFARCGYHATGMAELCSANSLGKGALYHYIGSKEELLFAIHDRVMAELVVRTDRVERSSSSPLAQLALLGEEVLNLIAEYPNHVWVFLHEFRALTGNRAARFRRQRRDFEDRVENILRAGITAGEIREVDPKLTALAWLGMYNYAYLWHRNGGAFSSPEVAGHFAEIFVQGVATPAGPEDV